jgi:hypothetical protein
MFATSSALERNLRAFVAELGREFSSLTLVLSVLGAAALARRQRRHAVLLLGSLALQWAYAFSYDIGDIYVFHIPGYLLMALLAAAGAAWLRDRTDRRHSIPWRHWATGIGGLLLGAGAIGPIIVPRLPALRAGRVPSFRSEHHPVEDGLADEQLRLRLVVQRLEQGALLFAEWRRLHPYYHVAHLEEGRPDLRFAELEPHRVGESEESSMIAFVRAQVRERAVYVERCMPELVDAGLDCWPVPVGVDTLCRLRHARGP